MVVEPAASFFVSGGTVPLTAASYVPREADRALLEALLEGRYAYVLTSRQMGKSSLSVRTMEALRERGVRTAFIDLTRVGGRNVSAEQWYAGLLGEIGRSLGDRTAMLAHWKAHPEIGPMQRLFGALREVALAAPAPLVVFIDEIDATKSLSFSTDEFFAGIRECFNRRVEDPAMARLAFCLIGVAIPSDLMSDAKLTPFNVGERIVLRDFSPSEARTLAAGLGPEGASLVARVHHWTGGHPFLTQSLGRRLAEEGGRTVGDVDRIVAEEFFGATARETNINLADVGNRVLNSYDDPDQIAKYRSDVLSLYDAVLKRRRVADDESSRSVAVLKLSGLVASLDGHLIVRNRVYDRVFDARWVDEHMPNQEMRRQRRAFWRGMIRAGVGAAVMLALVSALAVTAMGNARRANEALGQVQKERDHVTALATQAERSRVEATINAQSARAAQKAAQSQSGRALRLAKARAEALTEVRAQRDRADAQTRIALAQTRVANEQRLRAVASAEDARRAQGVATQQTSVAKHQTRIAVTAAQEARRQTYENYVNGVHTAQLAFQAGRPGIAEPILRSLQASPARGWETDFLTRESLQAGADGATAFHSDVVEGIAFLGDGHQFVSGGHDGRIVVVDLATRTMVKSLSINGVEGKAPGIRSIAPLPGGKSVMVVDDRSGLNLIRLGAGGDGWRVPTGDKATNVVAVSPDGLTAATCAEGGRVHLFRIDGPNEPTSFTCGKDELGSIAFAPDGRSLALASSGGAVYRCALDGRVIWSANGGAGQQGIAFSPDGRSVASVGVDGIFHLWTAQTGGERGRVRLGAGLVAVTPSRDGTRWIVGGGGGVETVVNGSDLSIGRRVAFPQDGATESVALSPDGETAIGGSDKGAVHIWSVVPQTKAVEVLPQGGDEVNAIDYSPKTGQVVAVSLNKGGWRLQTCDAKTWTPGWTKDYPDMPYAYSVALSPDGSLIALPDIKGRVEILDARNGKLLRTVPGNWVARFSPDGTRLATYQRDEVVLYDVRTGKPRLALPQPDRTIGIAFSPDGRFLATGSDDRLVRLWDLRKPATPKVLSGHTERVFGIAFSPDGRRLVSSGVDAARLWDVATGRETQTLRVRGGTGEVAQFTSDGSRVVTQMKGALDAATHVWDAATGRELVALPGGTEGRALCVLPNTILAGYANGTLLAFNGLSGNDRQRLEARRRETDAREKVAAEDEARQAHAQARQAKALAEKHRREAPFRRILDQADDAYRARRYGEALRLWARLKPGEPFYSTALDARAPLLAGLGRYPEALVALEEQTSRMDRAQRRDARWRAALLAYATGRQQRYAELCNQVLRETTDDDLKGAVAFYLWTVSLDPSVLLPENRAKVERVVAAAQAAQGGDLAFARFSAAFYLERTGRDRETLALFKNYSSAGDYPPYAAMTQALIARASARLGDETGYRAAMAKLRAGKARVERTWNRNPGSYNWDQRIVLDALARDAETPLATPPDAPARAKAEQEEEVRRTAAQEKEAQDLAERQRRMEPFLRLMNEADEDYRAQRYEEALGIWSRFKPEDLFYASARTLRLSLLGQMGRYDEAFAEYERTERPASGDRDLLELWSHTLLANTLGRRDRYAALANRLIRETPTDALQNDRIFFLWAVSLEPVIFTPENRSKIESVLKGASSGVRGKDYGEFSAAFYLVRTGRDREALSSLREIADAKGKDDSFPAIAQALIALASAHMGDEAGYRGARDAMRSRLAALDAQTAANPLAYVWDQRVVLHALAKEVEATPVASPKGPLTTSVPVSLGTLVSALGTVYFLRRKLLQ